MVRKKLSDMLREEAQKPAEIPSDESSMGQGEAASAAPPPPATTHRRTATGSRTKTSQSSTAAKQVDSKEVDSEEKATAIAAEVNTLKAELAAAIQQTDELNQQASELRAELEHQLATAKKLQTASEKTERRSQQLETELSAAKQTILQLVEVNSQLKQDLIAKPAVAIHEMTPKEIVSPPVQSLSKPLSTIPAEAKKNTLAATPLSQQELLRRQKKSLAHPVFPAGNPPGHLSEQDLGWVD